MDHLLYNQIQKRKKRKKRKKSPLIFELAAGNMHSIKLCEYPAAGRGEQRQIRHGNDIVVTSCLTLPSAVLVVLAVISLRTEDNCKVRYC